MNIGRAATASVLSGLCLMVGLTHSPSSGSSSLIDAAGPAARPREDSAVHRGNAGGAVRRSLSCGSQMWFDPAPRQFPRSDCGDVVTIPISPADINADGVPEIFEGISVDNVGYFVVVDSIWSQRYLPAEARAAEVLRSFKLDMSSEGPVPVSQVVCTLPIEFGEWFRARLPDAGGQFDPQTQTGWSWTVRGTVAGWLDCDADGDLDLVLHMRTYRLVCGGDENACLYSFNTDGTVMMDFHSETDVWLENVSAQRLVGDLDRNGQIDGGDLSVLLLNFTN